MALACNTTWGTPQRANAASRNAMTGRRGRLGARTPLLLFARDCTKHSCRVSTPSEQLHISLACHTERAALVPGVQHHQGFSIA